MARCLVECRYREGVCWYVCKHKPLRVGQIDGDVIRKLWGLKKFAKYELVG